MVHLLGSCLIILSAFFAGASALLYGTRFPWWRSSDGWHLFCYMAVIGGALLLWVGRLIALGEVWVATETGTWPVIRLLAFAAIAAVLGWRFFLIVGAWRDQRRKPKEKR